MMKFDSRFADALGQGDHVIDKPGIPKICPTCKTTHWNTPKKKER